jgi:hypothetical protein
MQRAIVVLEFMMPLPSTLLLLLLVSLKAFYEHHTVVLDRAGFTNVVRLRVRANGLTDKT